MTKVSTWLIVTLCSGVLAAQTNLDLRHTDYTAPGKGAVTRTGADRLSDIVSVKDYGATGDGKTDDLPAINRAFAAVTGKGQRLLFPAGVYAVSGTIVIPTKTQIVGVGRGDAGVMNTILKALPSFPAGGTLVELGGLPGPDFGVQIENLTIDGAQRAGICLANRHSEEQSYGRDLLLARCNSIGLSISTSGAQNSGPFENLEILPGDGHAVGGSTLCVQVASVAAFRGIRGLTCNAGRGYAARPTVAMALDGTGTYQDIHIEHFGTAVKLGNADNSADGLIFADGEFGPDVGTGIEISAAPHLSNQNLTLLGISCAGCTTLLNDAETGTRIRDTSIGWYLLGNGAGNEKAVWSSNYGIGTQLFGRFRAPQVQLTSAGPQPSCAASTRGTFWFVPGNHGTADHVQVCGKSARDTYAWGTIY